MVVKVALPLMSTLMSNLVCVYKTWRGGCGSVDGNISNRLPWLTTDVGHVGCCDYLLPSVIHFLHVVYKCVISRLSKGSLAYCFCSLQTCSLVPLIDRVCSLFYILLVYSFFKPHAHLLCNHRISMGWIQPLQ